MKSDLKLLFNISLFEDEVEQEWSWGFKSLKAFIQYLRKENMRVFSEFEAEAIRELLLLDPEAKNTLIHEFNAERALTLKSHLAKHILESMPYKPAYDHLIQEGLSPRDLQQEKGVQEMVKQGMIPN
ncbi:MAG: hypothetical protein M3Q07_28355 [Pseudobdellovibrionaceae bacterium]|nr:hypothetical protein [Pseudobdellovibrionaceae bacterium]